MSLVKSLSSKAFNKADSSFLFKSLQSKVNINNFHHAKSYNSSSLDSQHHDLSGIFPAICTPFKKLRSETISYKNLEKNLIQWSSLPFSGYAIHGFFGEYPYLTNEERFEILKMVRNIVGDKKIIVGSSCESVKKTLDVCESMKKGGADYSLIFTPHYYKRQMTYKALIEYYTKVADHSPLPVILHNIPSVTFIDLPAELIIELAKHPNIIGLKECGHNIAKIACICEHVKEKNVDFNVLTGSTEFLLDALRLGAVGSINSLSSFLGDKVLELYNLFIQEQEFIKKNLNQENASKHNVRKDKLQLIQNSLIQPDIILNEYGVPGLKAALDLFGYYGGPCRLPLTDLNEEEINNIRIILEQNGLMPKKFIDTDAIKTKNFSEYSI